MRVAHLLPTLEIGGKERSVADLCATAPASGIEPLVITYDAAPAGAPTIDPGCDHIALDRRDRGFAAALDALARKRGIDVLHAHGHVAAAYASGLAASAKLPTIVTIHSTLGGGWRWLPAILPALRRAEQLAAVSGDLARATGRLTLRPVATIPTGIDMARFGAPAGGPERAPGRPVTFGIAARLHPIKRHADLFAALRLLRESGVAARLRVAGDGPIGAAVRGEATTLPDVEMLGAVTDMPAFYRSLDAFILCSDHEGLPLALLEAMASGLPCIATRAGGMAALIDGGESGVIGVPRRDPAALATAMARLAADAELRRATGRHARAAAGRYTLAAQAEAYRACYRQLADTAMGGGAIPSATRRRA
jgi:glycosyltransferase involved in cell wall biosynthesis